MNLAVDIGNTHIKAGWFDGTVLREQLRLPKLSDVVLLVEQTPSVEAVILSSVQFPSGSNTPIADGPVATVPSELQPLTRLPIPVLTLDGNTPLPFVNTYLTPATLGTDRIAAVAGAQHVRPGQNVLVIDAGTCITYDVIDRKGTYRGGLISPGLRMRLRAMHTFTARLPLVTLELDDETRDHPGPDSPEDDSSDAEAFPSLTERSTEAGLRSGAVRGAAAEIRQMIRMYADKFSDLHVVLCGGDALYLLHHLDQHHPLAPASVTEVPELILIGLNCILQHNVNPKS